MAVVCRQLECRHVIDGLKVQWEIRVQQHVHNIDVISGNSQMQHVHLVLILAEDVDASLSKDLHGVAVPIETGNPKGIYTFCVCNLYVDTFVEKQELDHLS